MRALARCCSRAARCCSRCRLRRAPARPAGTDWTRFGFDAARSNAGPAATGSRPRTSAKLHRQQVTLDGTVDSSPIYLHGVTVERQDARRASSSRRPTGKTEAIDAASGTVLWRFTPPTYSSLAGIGADHDHDAGRRSEPHGDLRRRRPTGGSASSRVSDREGALGDVASRATRRTRSSPRRSTSRTGSCSRRPTATSATRRPTRGTS